MILRVKDLQAGYGGSAVLQGLDFELGLGQAVALLGRNGMGKTTFVRSILGQTLITAGEIEFQGQSVRGQVAYAIARRGIGLVPEGREIFTSLSVEENLIATSRPGDWTLERDYALFPRLAERRRNGGGQLSGGEQQMLAIGRALMTNPKLLILDEATEGLAPIVAQQLWSVIATLRSQSLGLLIIDKNLPALAEICDRFDIIEKGRMVWSGDKAEIMSSLDTVHARLGV